MLQKTRGITANELAFAFWNDRNILLLDYGKSFQIYVYTKINLYISKEWVVWCINSTSKETVKYYYIMEKDEINFNRVMVWVVLLCMCYFYWLMTKENALACW